MPVRLETMVKLMVLMVLKLMVLRSPRKSHVRLQPPRQKGHVGYSPDVCLG